MENTESFADINKGLSEALSGKLDVDTSGNGFDLSELGGGNNTQETQKQEVTDKTETNTDSSLKQETPETKTETPTEKTETKSESTPTKTFEELFSEKTAGKFKSWEEVEELLNKQKDDFFDDEVRKINELKKQGVKLDQAYFEMQSKVYEDYEDPIEILSEAMRLKPEYKGWSNEEIAFEIKNKYRMNEWSEEGEEETEVQKIMSQRLLREAEADRDFLINTRDSYSLKPKVDPEKIAQQQRDAQIAQQTWEKFVDEIDGKTSKFSLAIDEKTKFDLEIDQKVKKNTTETLKSMGTNANVYWEKFRNQDGTYDHSKVYETITKAELFDDAVKLAFQQGRASGSEQEVKSIKNIDFTADGVSKEAKPRTLADAIADSLKSN